MNFRVLTIVLIIAALFFFGWSLNRQPTEEPRKITSDAPSLPEQPATARTNQSPIQAAAPSADPRMSAIADIIARRDQQIADIKRRANGFETEADRRQIAKVLQESEDQIKPILSEEENRALQVEKFKETDLGKALIEHYAASDTDLGAISDYEKAIADVITTAGDLEGVHTASLHRLEQILGEERLKEFMNYRDPEWVEALNFLKRFNLRPETAHDLFKLRVEHAKIMLERMKQQLPPNNPTIKEPFRARVRELLGAEPADLYIREANGGRWLR